MNEKPATAIYRQLQRLAREQGKPTQELLELYVHERFLARLAVSPYHDRFVLKGGLLLAVLDVRRPTRDADLLALTLVNDETAMTEVVSAIVAIEIEPDGVLFDTSSIRTERIREEAEYEALRIRLPAYLATAKLRVQLDISVGDPVEATEIQYAELLGTEFTLLGYRLEESLAEKIVTMVSRGDANSRDRDWGDVYLLSGRHPLVASSLGEAVEATAAHRKQDLQPLSNVIDRLPTARQQTWDAYRRRIGAEDTLPEDFAEVVEAVCLFADPILAGDRTNRWNPRARTWG